MARVAFGWRKCIAAILAVAIAAFVLANADWNGLRNVPPIGGWTTTVVPGIHLIGRLGPSAAYAIETSEGLILIDTGLDWDAEPLKREMASLGLDWKKVHAILLTHVHGDHCGGAEHLRAQTGAVVYAGQADAPYLRAGGPREAFFSTYRMEGETPHSTTVDVELIGNEQLWFGNVCVRVLGTPGHTPGSTCYLVERAGLRALCSGDVIITLDGKRLGTYAAYLAPRYRGDARAFLASLTKLRAMPVPDLVLPGHPNESPTMQSPHLAPQQWTAMLDEGIKEMQQVIDRYQADGEAFLDGQPKRLLPELYYLGDFHERAVYALFVESKLFVVDAPGGPGLLDFIQARLHQLGIGPVEPTAVLLTACGEQETAGLEELVRRSNARVVCSPEGIAGIRQLCGPDSVVLSSDELPIAEWFPVTMIPLRGRGIAPIAYVLRWAGKTVLFAGSIPTDIDQNEPVELLAELAANSIATTQAYVESLERLAKVRPDLWLPAVPLNGRNANVYSRSWADVLEKNRRVAAYALRYR